MKAAEAAFQSKRIDQLQLIAQKASRDQATMQVVQSYVGKLTAR